PVIVTGVPVGNEPLVQPLVAVLPPVPEQCAACPRYTFVPSEYTKFDVHCAPAVMTCTPGCTAAEAAGAHADAAVGASMPAATEPATATAIRNPRPMYEPPHWSRVD